MAEEVRGHPFADHVDPLLERQRLREAARDGVGVLLISTELEEVLDLADRIVVIFRGRIIGKMDRANLDVERLGLLMSGAQEEAS